MVQLRQPDFSNIRRLASTMQAPQSSFQPITVRRLGEDPLSAKEWKQLIENTFIDMGITPTSSLLQEDKPTDNRSKTQKRLDTLKERLEKSGHKVPEPDSQGRQGFVGKLLNALGAPGGAVTTLVHDAIKGTNRSPLQSLKKGFTGEDRKIGSDILDELGVKNKVAKGVGGFLADVVLDPTTYLGVGLAKNVGTKATETAAKKALAKHGQKASSKELQKIIEHAVGPASRGASSTADPRIAAVAREMGRPVKVRARTDGRSPIYELGDVAPNLPRQINLEVGIPFTNVSKQIADLTPAFRKAGEAFRKMPTSNNPIIRSIGQLGSRTGSTVRNMFASYNLPSNVANLFRQRQMKINAGSKIGVQTGIKIDQMIGRYKGNEELHRAIAMSIENPSRTSQLLHSLPSEQRNSVQAAMNLAKKELDEIAKREVAAGVMDADKVRDFYFSHLLSGDKRALDEARRTLSSTQPNQLRSIGTFQQARTMETLEELEKFVEMFNRSNPGLKDIEVNYNIGQVVATRRIASETLIQNKKLVDNIKKLGTDYVRPLKKNSIPDPGFTKLEGVSKDLENFAISNDVAKFLQEWNNITKPGGSLNNLVEIWDTAMRIFKTSATATPGFHVRNFLGSIWNNWIMGVKNPRDYINAADMILVGKARRLDKNMEAINRIRIDLPNGHSLSGEEILRLANQYDLLHAGWMGDLGSMSVKEIGKSSGLRKAARLGHVREFGEASEDVARLAGFMDQLRKTGDPYASALNVKKHLFDYSELSNFEKKWLRRVIPFYTWSRKNIPLQLEALITRPGMYTGLAHAQDEGAEFSGIDIEEMPDWLANSAMVPLGNTEEGYTRYLNQFALPANDIMEILRGASSPQDFLKYMMQQTAPFVRGPIEYSQNKQFFTGQPIDRDAELSGENVSGEAFINYLFQQSGLPYNLYRSLTDSREITDVVNPPNPEDARPEDAFIARNLAPFDPKEPLGFAGMFGEYNPEYWLEEALPYRHAQQLQGEIRRLTRKGETVYTKTEIDQAEELGLTPEQVRLFRQLLDDMGERKTKKNILELAENQ
ncbi:hypothetical protein DCC39_10310 [Pueribacillus theae]|uniref:Large polyvalent protein associated domain-containing protein n=1 Tax=Pueribacillus theae TaxID=2171751 RepID=A0A2U1K103_9BACI|nr:hypothetical protein [Pueribacillus theae]PWA11082.1 hypothetical protein DCC39_10310 [Pueribacillus theae]